MVVILLHTKQFSETKAIIVYTDKHEEDLFYSSRLNTSLIEK